MNSYNLPLKIPIFPLSNVVFFPKTILPLNIFEQRYIQLVDDSMRSQKLFGMVQPKLKSASKVYEVGCLGKIVNFTETKDKRYIISLEGVSRFRIKEELASEKLYRTFKVDYSDFQSDFDLANVKPKTYNKKNLLNKIKILFKKKNYLVDWTELEKLNFHEFMNTMCMICPFSAEEKQKLIEAIEVEDKLNTLEEIISFNLVGNLENNTIQ